MDAQHSFGVWLKRRRKGLDLTQAELARQLDCSVAAVRKFEAEERRPSGHVVDRLAAIFDIPAEERTAFLRFARGDWYFSPAAMQDAPWRGPVTPSPDEVLNRQVSVHTPLHRSNLPAQLTSFVGRERELAEVRELVKASRLVTLTGAGGSGKTRLAIEAATGLIDGFRDGVRLVELAPLSDPALVVPAVAASLGIAESEGQLRPPRDVLVDFLRGRQLLLLLDNCEHLIAAVVELVGALLHHCPDLCVLATSREPLGIAGETVWLAPAMSMPRPGEQLSIEELARYDAVRLFVERAKSVLPSFSLTEQNAAAVIQLCNRLDGIPLAIELAAARVKLLQVRQIVERLDDRFRLLAGGRGVPPRHQTLHALIDWSHDLLSPAEQRLLRRLSVFAGGFALEAVETVCNEENTVDVLDTLAQLVSKSLVVVGRAPGRESRYDLHETIQQYAWRKLDAAGETAVMQARHAEYYGRLLESALPRFHFDDRVFLDRDWLEMEMDNWRAVMGRSLDADAIGPEWGIRVVSRLMGFCFVHQRMTEHRRWVGAALARASGATPTNRAALLTNEAGLQLLHQPADAQKMAAEALTLFRQLADKEGMVRAAVLADADDDDPEQAMARLVQLLPLATEAGSDALFTLHARLGWRAQQSGSYDLAINRVEQALRIARQQDQKVRQSEMLEVLGVLFVVTGDMERATELFLESLTLARALQPKGRRVSFILNALGDLTRLQGDYERANGYLQEALASARETGDVTACAFTLLNRVYLLIAQGDLSQATAALRECVDIYRREHITFPNLGWVFLELAWVSELTGKVERAARLHGVAERAFVDMTLLAPADREDITSHFARVRAQLGEAGYAAALAEGRAMSLEEAMAYALEE